jgi:hypothetical protein
MKDFNTLSGPWTGLSIQGGFRLTERLQLSIIRGKISGTGSDMDGEFEVFGAYDPTSNAVHLVRRYTSTNRDDEGVGVPYDYLGIWDGMMVAGTWQQRDYLPNNGPFEMWPDREEDRKELAIELHDEALALTSTGAPSLPDRREVEVDQVRRARAYVRRKR